MMLRIVPCISVMCRTGAFPPSHCDEAKDFFHHSNDARSQLAVERAAYLHGEHPCYGSAPHGAYRPRAMLQHACRSDPHCPALSAELVLLPRHPIGCLRLHRHCACVTGLPAAHQTALRRRLWFAKRLLLARSCRSSLFTARMVLERMHRRSCDHPHDQGTPAAISWWQIKLNGDAMSTRFADRLAAGMTIDKYSNGGFLTAERARSQPPVHSAPPLVGRCHAQTS